MDPASGKCVQRQDVPDHRVPLKVPTPTLFFPPGLRSWQRRAHLVEQHEHWFLQPFQYPHLGCKVAGVPGVLGRVDEVEHDVGGVPRRPECLLTQPERAVAVAVEQLPQEPAERVVGHTQALEEPD